MDDNLIIDGNYLEGGGQIVRTSLALSTILQKPFIIENIRKGRSEGGLKHQHLYCIKALEQLCNAKATGAELGSTKLEFYPNKLLPKNLNVDVETAGSVSLLLQAVLLPCLFAEKKTRIKIHGGTDVKWAMPVDYLKEIFLPQLRRYCNSIEAKIIRRGYYPRGNGQIEIIIQPKYSLAKFNSQEEFFEKVESESQKISLAEQGHLIHIKGVSHSSADLQHQQVAERQAEEAKHSLLKLNCPVNIRTEYSEALSTGSGIALWAIFSEDKDEISFANPIILGADSLGERGKRAEIVGKEAAESLIKEILSKAPVDSHLGDNLIPFIGLFGGKINVSEITNHTLTNIYTAERFLGKRFNIDELNKVISAE